MIYMNKISIYFGYIV